MLFQPVVLAAIEKDGKFLLTLRNHYEDPKSSFHNKWQLPGGKVEFGESVEDALKREIKEELDTDITIRRLFPKIYYRVRKNTHFIFFCFVCEIDPKAKIVLNNEATEYDWFSLPQIRNLPFLPFTDEVIQDILASNE
ncbi:hypothetical protein A3D77_00395 [Candidatus Gottesmanbacteria bacterium RIFCSPHIGHO2_02_FULL_39_11]|uniref:Nudix hydrolase domain-containing protein n=1 Tax=Candidatus Gottesmanbacteria bacterium RIFCSPHIGHO2_02_FULL_39_11 TaxID=1798382 RepID=A0A1F5ZL55_9BACT|nr:MAG: hypothetical protein A3D77_00395 [Candidatus Gottesmanbacteria bacterium RIFCSPHIGHO2_02_FULL_39_11]